MVLPGNLSPFIEPRLRGNIDVILPPLSPSMIEATPIDRAGEVSHVKFPNEGWNRNTRRLSEQKGDDIALLFYDIYVSPCRGILRASNDELMDYIDLDEMNDDVERNVIISYNNGDENQNNENDLYNTYNYYYDDIEYCGATFYGGCRFSDLDELEVATRDMSLSIPIDTLPSNVNFTVMYDYEIHYVDGSSGAKLSEGMKGVDGIQETSTSSFATTGGGSNESEGGKIDEPQPPKRGDPIPAVEHLETIVLEHLGEVLGLSRRGCDSDSSSSSSISKSQTYKHDFSDEDLSRILAISSEPKDVLDPDHSMCLLNWFGFLLRRILWEKGILLKSSSFPFDWCYRLLHLNYSFLSFWKFFPPISQLHCPRD